MIDAIGFMFIFNLIVLGVNVYILNEILKDRQIMVEFVKASSLYVGAYAKVESAYHELSRLVDDLTKIFDKKVNISGPKEQKVKDANAGKDANV